MWEQIVAAMDITVIEPCIFEAFALVYILNPPKKFSAREILIYLLEGIIAAVVYAVLLVTLILVASANDIRGSWFIYVAAFAVYVPATIILGFLWPHPGKAALIQEDRHSYSRTNGKKLGGGGVH